MQWVRYSVVALALWVSTALLAAENGLFQQTPAPKTAVATPARETVRQRGIFEDTRDDKAQPGLFQNTPGQAPFVGTWSDGLPPGFEKIQELSKGNFGRALLVRNTRTGEMRILKISHESSDRAAETFAREQTLLNESGYGGGSPAVLYRDPNNGTSAITMAPVFAGPGEKSLAMPLATILAAHMNGDQLKLPPQYRITTENVGLWRDAVDAAVTRLHDRKMIHNDIHLQNMLMRWDETGKPVAELIDFGLASRESESQHPIGAFLYQSYQKLQGRGFDPLAADRYSASVVKAFLTASANGEMPTVAVHSPGGDKPVMLQPTPAAVITAELKEYVAPPAKPLPEKQMSAKLRQMLCEAKYADLSWSSPPAPRRDVANIGR